MEKKKAKVAPYLGRRLITLRCIKYIYQIKQFYDMFSKFYLLFVIMAGNWPDGLLGPSA